MNNGKITIRKSQSGWVVYFGNDVENFSLFRSDEPERFVKFITEKVAGIKIDQLLKAREEEIRVATEKMDASQKRES